MNRKILGLLALVITAAPIAANAQTTTLDYQGYVMGGTSTVLPPGVTNPFDDPNGLVTVSTTATFTAEITYSGSMAHNDLQFVSDSIQLAVNNGSSFSFQNLRPATGNLYTVVGSANCPNIFLDEGGGCIALTTQNGAVTGATINIYNPTPQTSQLSASIGPNGDAFQLVNALTVGGCGGVPGSTSINLPLSPCNVNVSNPTAGVWKVTSAPEIDTRSAASGLTLLFGGLAVLRGRRRSNALE